MKDRILFGVAATLMVAAFAGLVWYGGERLQARNPLQLTQAEAAVASAEDAAADDTVYALARCPEQVQAMLLLAMPAGVQAAASEDMPLCLMVSYHGQMYFSYTVASGAEPPEYRFHLFILEPNGRNGIPAWEYKETLKLHSESDWCVYQSDEGQQAVVGWRC